MCDDLRMSVIEKPKRQPIAIQPTGKSGMLILFLYTVTIFLGALLLFLVQPMVGRMLLPLLGGAPAVWNTALVFFQAALLAGYAYAHVSTRWLGVRRQTALHALLLVVAIVALPITIPHGWAPPTEQNPVFWLLALLTVVVGFPFFVVSATSPLLQRWFAASGHRDAADPYFLYAAGNCGSLLALVAYPVLIEPRLGLSNQCRWWAIGYGTLVLLTISCGLLVLQNVRRQEVAGEPAGTTATPASAERLTARRRLRWVILAFVPCSLMLSVTMYVTSEIAPVPLLWVIPLGIYLLTFILVFAKRRLLPHRWMVRALPLVVLPLVIMLASSTLKAAPLPGVGWPVALHFVGLFVVAMVCHGELANDRPTVSHLTEFYLWISTGGVLGGIFNALLAPVIFPTVLEYPLTLLLACLLMPQSGAKPVSQRTRALDFVLPALLGLLTAILIPIMERVPPNSRGIAVAVEYGVPALLCLMFFRRPLRFTLGVLAIFLATTLALRSAIHTLVVARSFFGIHRVEVFPGQEYVHILKHGTTTHGMQSLDPRHRRVPLAYFTRAGPLGQVIAAIPDKLMQHVGVIGLGAGTVACYAKAGQQWTFYDIDPEVERIARNPQYFTYLEDCPASVKIVLGDARLSLQSVPDHEYGFMILDAYNSDTVPLHLVTREALALYMRKLALDGVLAFHITNRHLDLEPVFAKLAQDAGVFALCEFDPSSLQDFERSGRMESRWMVVTRDPQQLGSLLTDPRWHPPRARPGVGLWTDDYVSVFSVFNWNNLTN